MATLYKETIDEDPWFIKFISSVPQNMSNWANNKPTSGTKYNAETHDLYRNVIVRI